jgi:hypothetical protein
MGNSKIENYFANLFYAIQEEDYYEKNVSVIVVDPNFLA